MSKRDFIIRYLLIIRKLRTSKYASFSEINEYLRLEFELIDTPKIISLRTFQRDLNEIRTIFNIDIQCNNSNHYFIQEDELLGYNNRMMEAFDIIHSLNTGQQLTPYILLEERCSLGTGHIFDLLKAIRLKHLVLMEYQKYFDGFPTERIIEPYALKEFKGRWYLLSKDTKDDLLKTFGLDRIKSIKLLKKHYISHDTDCKEHFKNCYGIIKSEELESEKLILSFEPLQGQYVKSYPLHRSQKTLIDNDKEFRISLEVFITHDLVMELLSYGAELRVIEPKSLVDIMSNTIGSMSQLYKK